MPKKRTITLEKDFRISILKRAIEITGSKYALAMRLGYGSVGSGKTINEWIEGSRGILLYRLVKLADVVSMSINEILKHEIK